MARRTISITTQTVGRLESLLKDFEFGSCQFWACDGPGRLKTMITCRRCWSVHRLRAIIRSMKRKVAS